MSNETPRPDQAIILEPDSELLRKVRESAPAPVQPYKLDGSPELPKKSAEELLAEQRIQEMKDEKERVSTACHQIAESLAQGEIASAGVYLKGFLLQYDFGNANTLVEKVKQLTNTNEQIEFQAIDIKDLPPNPKKHIVQTSVQVGGQERTVTVFFSLSSLSGKQPILSVERVAVR